MQTSVILLYFVVMIDNKEVGYVVVVVGIMEVDVLIIVVFIVKVCVN